MLNHAVTAALLLLLQGDYQNAEFSVRDTSAQASFFFFFFFFCICQRWKKGDFFLTLTANVHVQLQLTHTKDTVYSEQHETMALAGFLFYCGVHWHCHFHFPLVILHSRNLDTNPSILLFPPNIVFQKRSIHFLPNARFGQICLFFVVE